MKYLIDLFFTLSEVINLLIWFLFYNLSYLSFVLGLLLITITIILYVFECEKLWYNYDNWNYYNNIKEKHNWWYYVDYIICKTLVFILCNYISSFISDSFVSYWISYVIEGYILDILECYHSGMYVRYLWYLI